MKKFWFAAAAFIFILASCNDGFLSAPYMGTEGSHFSLAAPGNVTATHGNKQSITVSWGAVNNADYYYIYRADSPLDSFIRCGETSSNSYTFGYVTPGSSIYYRVSAVLYNGSETNKSNYVLGTSLAQPVISDITDVTEDKAEVTWYMENVTSYTYRENLLYIVYCFSGNTEIAQLSFDASILSENRAVFTGLNANTTYEYQVEAYLRSNQSASEKSDKMDAATARRFRPGAPMNLTATHGTSESRIVLSFMLPDMVDIALGDNMYDPKPLYFTISKRVYSESGNNEYQVVCSYFGSISANAAGKTGGKTFNDYMPGSYITWEDSGNNVRRDVVYEYRVQSYVDDTAKIISSDSSQASATGWALSGGDVSYGTTVYNLGNGLYDAAKLPVNFNNFDPRNIPYEYTVKITVEPIGDGDPLEPSSQFTVERKYYEYSEVKNYLIKMEDLTVKSSSSNLGRGIYSVEISVGIPNEEIISTFKALGKIEISENTKPIVVNNFSVQDGYKDKFVLIWDNYPNIKYLIQESSNGTSWPADTVGTIINSNPSDDEDAEPNTGYSFEITGQAQGIKKYFRIRPARTVGGDKWGQWVYTTNVSETLGVPVLSVLEEKSYSSITPLWKPAQKADTYRIKYRYTADGANAPYKIADEKHIKDLSLDANGNYRFTFKPDGHNDVSKAGNEIQLLVEALNKGLQEKINSSDEISTSSNLDVKRKLIGPANLKSSATKAVSTQEIDVSWDAVEGADGYYVFRRQFNMTNAAEDGTEAVVYYIPAVTSDIKVTGKNLTTDASNSKTDTQTVKAAASYANSRYTLKDISMSDNEYNSFAYGGHALAYRNQQNDMVQGMSYRYFIVPVISRGGAVDPLNVIEFNYSRDASNKHTNILSYKIDDGGHGAVTYTGAAALEQEGFLIGFGQNVTATKGTYVISGNVNDGIQISWDAPPRLSTVPGFTPRYTVHRRVSGSSSWSPVISVNSHAYLDTPNRGVAYEYLIGVGKYNNNDNNPGYDGPVSQPQSNPRFIEHCSKQRSQRNVPDMLGYMLDYVKLDSVTRNVQTVGSNFAEEVKWYSSNIENSYNSGNFTWSIDGYDVYVMNRNINAAWHHIANITNIPNQINQSVKVTNVQGEGTLQSGLLKVMRDYKHFFKVRSYILKDGEKVYGPDPAWTYQYRWGTNQTAHIAASAQMENDYVKWGARQITADEFITISTLYMARGIERVNGTAWNTAYNGFPTYAARTRDASTGMGGSGSIRAESNFGVNSWDIDFNNYKDDLQARCGQWMTFITIQGRLWAGTNASNQYPQRYGDSGWINITGPWDTPNLYNGRIIVGTGGDTDLYWNGNLSGSTIRSRIAVEYPSGTARQNIPYRGIDTPLIFSGQGDARYQQDAWK